MQTPSVQDMLEREKVANKRKHWVRAVTACNSRCIFCLDSDTPRNVYLPLDEVKAELLRGREELDAEKVIISGGEASLHPEFFEMIRYARDIGYDRVQTVTNGWMWSEKDFYDRGLEAGIGEITFSLHGHTEELHDYLTQQAGSFKRLMKGMIRAIRDRKIIVNVDVVINKQNVAVIDKIVELAMSVGVTEFDLLHVIPQAAAFENRDLLFYDVREHLETLQKVFRLNRHPRFVIWTNRFPVSFLEGLEDLIQDPHKMLDEVNGRRFQVRRYLDTGAALDCRQPERCVHCFIEPFCTSTDEVIRQQRAGAWEVWWIGEDRGQRTEDGELPFGCGALGVEVERLAELPAERPLYARVHEAGALEGVGGPLTLVVETAEQLEAWVPGLPEDVELEVRLNRATAPWLLAHREQLPLEQMHIHQRSWEKLEEAVAHDVRDPAAFFRELALPVRVSGLPACMAPGTELVEETAVLEADLFDDDTGRLRIRELARWHVRERYRAKSVRCADCRLSDRCEGPHINMIRDQGLRLCDPLVEGAWADEAERQLVARWPEPPTRVGTGQPPLPPAPSLPGYEQPADVPLDPLAQYRDNPRTRARQREVRRGTRIPKPRGNP